jgi:hypothetical protein
MSDRRKIPKKVLLNRLREISKPRAIRRTQWPRPDDGDRRLVEGSESNHLKVSDTGEL